MPANPTLCCSRTGHPVPPVAAWSAGPQRATRRLLALLLGLAGSLLGGAPALAALADEPTGCSLLWQVQITSPRDGSARQLLVDMAFDAGPRNRSVLRLPGGWAGLAHTTGQDAPESTTSTTTTTQAVADAPLLRSVAHAPGERVRLHWRYSGPTDAVQGGSVRLAPTWFALAGMGVLPVPDELDERNPPSACVQLRGDWGGDDGSAASPIRWASSHGQADGHSALFRLPAATTPLRQRVQQALYAGGALDRFQPPVGGLPLTLVRPSAAGWLAPVDGLGQAALQHWAAQRQFWGDNSPAAPLLLLLLPGSSPATGGRWHQALALQAPADLAWPGADAETLLTRALLSTWVPDRFGPLVHAGRNDAALRAWFSDGLLAHYSHRLLLRSGRMTPDTYAQVMNQGLTRLAAMPANTAALPDNSSSLAGLRGEWLALQWHNALRAAGQPGLDSVLQRLLLAPTLARHEGPISAPLATHRLVAALRPVLGDVPLRDIQRQAERAEPAALSPTSLGPCFSAAAGVVGSVMQYQPVPQALQQADCQGWLGLGPQALLGQDLVAQDRMAKTGNHLRSAASAVAPDTAPAPRHAGNAAGLKKGNGLHGRSGRAKAGKGHSGKLGSSKARAGKTSGKTTGAKSAQSTKSAKSPGKRSASAKKAGKH